MPREESSLLSYAVVISLLMMAGVKALSMSSIASSSNSHLPSFSASRSMWHHSWFPFAVLPDLDGTKVYSATLLGKRFVYWKSGNDNPNPKSEPINFKFPPLSSTWSLAEDVCPHRLAPLSEGYLQAQSPRATALICRYHGWEFGGNGTCLCVPQASDNAVIDDRRSRLLTYPVREAQQLLWFWPQANPTEEELKSALAEPLPIQANFKDAWMFQRDVPVDFELMVENVFDPSHANFLHGSTTLNKLIFSPKLSVPMDKYKLLGNITMNGFRLQHSTYSSLNPLLQGERQLIAPSTVFTSYSNLTRHNWNFYATIHFLPKRPGETRVIGSFIYLPTRTTFAISVGNMLRRLMLTVLGIPVWFRRAMSHISANTIEEQDLLIMTAAFRALQDQRMQNCSWKTAYYLPTKADKGVSTFRTWFDIFSSEKVNYLSSLADNAKHKDQEVSLDNIIDRWAKHTANCHSCRRTVNSLIKCHNALNKLKWLSLVSTMTVPALKYIQHPIIAKARSGALISSLSVLTIFLFRMSRSLKSFIRCFFRGSYPFVPSYKSSLLPTRFSKWLKENT
eukprot:gene9068-10007_t